MVRQDDRMVEIGKIEGDGRTERCRSILRRACEKGMMINQGVGESSETKEPRKCMRVGCMNAREMQEDRVGLGSMGLSRWLVG